MPNFRAVGSVLDHIFDHKCLFPALAVRRQRFMSGLKDAGHLFRFAGLFVVAFLVFLVVRGYVVPKTFGQYGHYRGAAMGEIAAASGEVCRAPDVRKLPLGYCRYQNQGRACARELRGLPRRALSASACAAAAQGEPLPAFRGPDRSPASPRYSYPSPRRRSSDSGSGRSRTH